MDVPVDLKDNVNRWQLELEKRAEVGWQEFRTQSYIKQQLGKPFWQGKTGLVYSVGEGRTRVFFRAELDGLPTEQGVLHVCGHATHLAALMGAYWHFKRNPILGYKIYFVFQPAEETYPSGAAYLIDNCSFLKECSLGIAFHLFPYAKKGAIINPVFASASYFTIRLLGKGTHIKNKYQTSLDMVIEAGKLAVKINRLKSMEGIINVGVLRAGEVSNRIAGEAVLSGDIRSLTSVSRDRLKSRLDHLVEEVEGKGIRVDYYFNTGYPLLQNRTQLIKRVDRILPISDSVSSFASEDFSLYPGSTLFLLVGTGSSLELHDTTFKVSKGTAEMLCDYWLKVGNNLELLVE